MIRRNILRLAIVSIIGLFALSGAAYAEHPARTIMNFYNDELQDQNTVEPYIVSILALNELAHDRHYAEVRGFIEWYFSRLNYPDRHGLTGTIYVYVLEDDCEKSLQRYDSVDGYAGMFLHLLHQYVVKTGDIDILRKNWERIEDIVYLLPYLQDDDGLTRALPDSQVKYLMDNCEAYGGVTAYLSLRAIAGKGNSAYYNHVRKSVKTGIFEHLYEPGKAIFAWAIEEKHKSSSSWNCFYPDAYAQLLPIYFDLLTDTPLVQNKLWYGFKQRYADIAPVLPIEQRIVYNLTKLKMGEKPDDKE